ncbi:hypothetical protein E1263_39110 [Kribbella antibiotica]|uniref:Uncharacterized protein n=1 Tax=Kribbella antibiotica TaxID=190195 RepID=A0A4R4YLB5_9ACTN|nr:hypothetical protein [Kribbella antibiotica]TDD45210.1 hypothetical protein E1263_39110 [Kribbella antibiotica]
MDDDRVVGAELERLAATDPLDPIDPHAMLTRGRRSRRTRRLVGAGGGVAAVAVVAIGATLLPNLNATTPDADAAGTDLSSEFSAVPGVQRGEAGTGVQITYAEANRRCALRYPEVKRPLRPAAKAWAGAINLFQLQRGDSKADCMVPGGDKPSAALVAAAQRDPVPTTQAGQLRNCSVGFWTDLTKWRVLASDVAPGSVSSVVAMSPSGKSVVECVLMAATQFEPARMFQNSQIVRTPVQQHTFQAAFKMNTSNEDGFHYAVGRMSPDIVRITIEQAGHGKHEIKVKDGWYALAWLNEHPSGLGLQIIGYHKDGSTDVRVA